MKVASDQENITVQMRPATILGLCAAAVLAGCASPGGAATDSARGKITLPGPQYEVLRSGPPDGAHPTRADMVSIRYVGRLHDGQIFSTSADEGRGTSDFPVRGVVPGFSALVQLMRPGDAWRFTLPSYLAYGAKGRTHIPPEPTLKRDVPPNSTLIFDVELVAIKPAG